MAQQVTRRQEGESASAFLQRFGCMVTNGPGDLDIAYAMSAHGFDDVKWAEGQGIFAELVTCDRPEVRCLETASHWYAEAAAVAQRALEKQPRLLEKLRVPE